MLDVAFITVNYNTRELVEALISFFRQARLPFSFSVTVVDNGSTDGSLEFLDTCPEVLTLKMGENLGYGKAMNRGIAQSHARYLCLINTDVELNEEALTALVEHLDRHREVQVASPVIRYADGRIQGFFFKFGLPTLYLDLYKKLCNSLLKKRVATAQQPIRVDGIAGAFIFCRSSLVRHGKLFDENFFFYYEDTELAHRLLRAGHRCEVLPRQSIIHYGGGSSSLRHIQLFYAGKYRYVRLLHGDGHARAVLLQDLVRVGAKRLFYEVAGRIAPSEHINRKRESYSYVTQTLRELRTASKGGVVK